MPSRPPPFHPPGYRDKAQRDAVRGTRTERGYTNAWLRASRVFLIEHPLCMCAECALRRVPRVATVVDHITPHRGNAALFWDPGNWQSMAKRCHDRKTMMENPSIRGGIDRTNRRGVRIKG